MSCLGKVVESDEADGGCDHVCSIHRIDRYLVAYHIKMQCVLYLSSHHSQIHMTTFPSAKAMHNLFAGHLYSSYGSIVDRDDAVSCHDAHFLTRSFGDRLDDHKCILQHIELHADAFE